MAIPLLDFVTLGKFLLQLGNALLEREKRLAQETYGRNQADNEQLKKIAEIQRFQLEQLGLARVDKLGIVDELLKRSGDSSGLSGISPDAESRGG